MGAWGYKAYENDTAMDWLNETILKKLKSAIFSKRSDPHEILAALAIVDEIDLKHHFNKEDLEAALDRIRASDEALGWRFPDKRRAYVNALAKRLGV